MASASMTTPDKRSERLWLKAVHIPGRWEGTLVDSAGAGIVSHHDGNSPNQWVPVLE
jgi:hypothetical protein